MPSYSRLDIILVRYPFSDLTGVKVRPAVLIGTPHRSLDLLIVPLTSRTTALQAGEFVLEHWKTAGLNVETAVKRGLYTVQTDLVVKRIGTFSNTDATQLETALRGWLGL